MYITIANNQKIQWIIVLTVFNPVKVVSSIAFNFGKINVQHFVKVRNLSLSSPGKVKIATMIAVSSASTASKTNNQTPVS